MLLDTSGQSHLFANLCASRRGEGQTGSVSLDGDDFGTRSGRANVDHLKKVSALICVFLSCIKTYEDFVLCKLGNLGLLAVCCLDSEQSSKEEVVDLELSVNVGKMAAETKDKTNETISTTQSRIYTCTNTYYMLVESSPTQCVSHTDQTTRNSKLQVVVLCEQGHDS